MPEGDCPAQRRAVLEIDAVAADQLVTLASGIDAIQVGRALLSQQEVNPAVARRPFHGHIGQADALVGHGVIADFFINVRVELPGFARCDFGQVRLPEVAAVDGWRQVVPGEGDIAVVLPPDRAESRALPVRQQRLRRAIRQLAGEDLPVAQRRILLARHAHKCQPTPAVAPFWRGVVAFAVRDLREVARCQVKRPDLLEAVMHPADAILLVAQPPNHLDGRRGDAISRAAFFLPRAWSSIACQPMLRPSALKSSSRIGMPSVG